MSKKMKFSEYLKEKRIKVGLSQGAVAQKLGYSTAQFVSNWERGLAKPPISKMKRLAFLYKLTIDDLLDAYMSASAEKIRAAMKRSYSR